MQVIRLVALGPYGDSMRSANVSSRILLAVATGASKDMPLCIHRTECMGVWVMLAALPTGYRTHSLYC